MTRDSQASKTANYDEAVRALLALGRELASPQQARVQKFGLENITILAEELGEPHRAVPCVHVGGTNGKGSTAAMLESILRATGLRTGLYTSPHLERINERIRLNGQDISDTDFADAWTRVRDSIERLMAAGKLKMHPTFFECLTAMAFVAFAEAKLDLVVYEVGLGGRLDATNIVHAEAAVITQIDFDHENFLGHSIAEIAAEKAGIIKPGVPVVSAVECPEARDVVVRHCSEMNVRLVEIDGAWRLENVHAAGGCYSATVISADGPGKLVLEPALPGRFQLRNALAAAMAAAFLAERGFPVTDAAIERGIASVNWPGRLERVSIRPAVYLDGAHNPAAARELLKFWEENFAGRRIVLIYGAMRDKAVDEIAGLLFPRADRILLTQPRQPRAISAPLLAEITSHYGVPSEVIPDPAQALDRAMETANPEDTMFVTGSLYLVGDLRKYWRVRQSEQAAAGAKAGSSPQFR